MKRTVCLMIGIVMLFALCGCSNSDSANSFVRISMGACPDNIDPQLAESTEALAIVRNCFEGLFRSDGGKVEKAACSDYSVSDDGLTWTFILRDAKWSDGQTVSADDFAFGLIRAISPETVSPDAELLTCIKGAQESLSGQAYAGAAGIYAEKDKLTLSLVSPEPDLPEILSRAMCMPCREDVFEKAAGRYGMSAELVVCNGPYTLSAIKTTVQLIANENYSGKFAPKCSKAVFTYGASDTERIESVLSGISTAAAVSPASLDNGMTDLDITAFNDTAWAVLINPNADVIGESSVSSAFKDAFDSGSYNEVMPYGFTAFGGAVADDLTVDGRHYGDTAGKREGLKGNGQARQKLINALKSRKGKLPTFTLIYPESDQLKPVAMRIAQYWQQNLGATINIEAVASREKLYALTGAGEYQLALCPIESDDGAAATAVRHFTSGHDRLRYGFEIYGVREAVGLTGSVSADAIKKAESALTGDCHFIPVAMNGHCYIHLGKLENVRFDMIQGSIALY